MVEFTDMTDRNQSLKELANSLESCYFSSLGSLCFMEQHLGWTATPLNHSKRASISKNAMKFPTVLNAAVFFFLIRHWLGCYKPLTDLQNYKVILVSF